MRTAFVILPLGFAACEPSDIAKDARSVNVDPTIEIVSPMYGHTVTTDMEVDFFAEVDDEETATTALRVSWTSDLDGDLNASSPDEDGDVAFQADTLSVGGHTITATVTDGDGGSAFASTLLNVFEPGEAPVVALLSPSNGEKGIAGEILELEAVAEDPDDMLQDLIIDFEVISDDQSAGCSAEPDEDGVASCEVTLEEGRVFIRVTATDPLGQTGTDEMADFEVVPAEEHDGDDDGFSEVQGDCDDDNFTVHPDAPEIVDDIDNDCDGEIDEDTDTSDDDGDGMTELDGDCDDDDDTIFTGATEYLNGVDDDCDGTIDEGTIAYDDDGDCYCEAGEDILGCTGSISEMCLDLVNPGDCNDSDEDIHPYAPEVVDGADNDCDGEIDETTDSFDDDGDGYTEVEGDCDDSAPGIHPGATEELNGIDDDCDDIIDEGTAAFDDDGDCYCEGGSGVEECTGSDSASCLDSLNTGDCNDADEDIHPFAMETCGFTDMDCDGLVGSLDPDTDLDLDGFSGCGDIDCDDYDPSVYPGATEYCNSTDDDCNGIVDDPYAADTSAWFFDADGDGWGSETAVVDACSAPAGYLSTSGDCADSDYDINPDADERCDDDDVDEDCDGLSEEGDAIGKTWWHPDADGDGYPDATGMFAMESCDPWGSYIAARSDDLWDCDDGRDWVYPGADEVCDVFEIDEDCDGVVNDAGASGGIWHYQDSDGDGFGDPESPSVMLCPGGDTEGYELYTVTNSSDCCDSDPWAYPGAETAFSSEVWCPEGGYDYNCDGSETKSFRTWADCGLTCGTTQGWTGSSLPSCGASATWLYDCDVGLSWDLCTEDRASKVQTCL